jgi:hypothetical protein
MAAIILALCLPAVQLGSAFVTGLILLLSSRADKYYQLRQLGKITLGIVLGTGVGIVAMVGIGFVLG